MPKQKITKEMVIDAAFAIARSEGMEQVIVKKIAEKLNCSVQPIYSYCTNMDGLKKDVENKVRSFVNSYILSRINKDDLFASTGKAYIQLANDEPHILKIFVMQKRENITSFADLYALETNDDIAHIIAKDLNISLAKAQQLHLNMLIYTIGIGTIFSVSSPGIPLAEIYEQQAKAYEAFLAQAKQS
ncbi:MAG: TetR/AcrR family transcriptional regulator [Erysipelotrichaceae bacterium]|nr:TetR/AcrR family transcriptional regulator [Erysipelotrichaceae bacterium]MDY5252854.1 TetR/AcrR family transcriptional regulator [Erysipelotrichaceae bacterium]